MDSLTRSCLSLSCFIVLAFFITGCRTPTHTKPVIHRDVCSEQTVFVGDLGKDENVALFRILLGQSLRKFGFTVVLDRQQADITLSGVMEVRSGRGGWFSERKLTLVYTTINAETAQGLVWTIDSQPERGKIGDQFVMRAEEVTNSLLQACLQRWKENK
jgi:hypothetical protein